MAISTKAKSAKRALPKKAAKIAKMAAKKTAAMKVAAKRTGAKIGRKATAAKVAATRSVKKAVRKAVAMEASIEKKARRAVRKMAATKAGKKAVAMEATLERAAKKAVRKVAAATKQGPPNKMTAKKTGPPAGSTDAIIDDCIEAVKTSAAAHQEDAALGVHKAKRWPLSFAYVVFVDEAGMSDSNRNFLRDGFFQSRGAKPVPADARDEARQRGRDASVSEDHYGVVRLFKQGGEPADYVATIAIVSCGSKDKHLADDELKEAARARARNH